jgi:hypothetical protein
MPMIEISDEHMRQLIDCAAAHRAETAEAMGQPSTPYTPEQLLANILMLYFIEDEMRDMFQSRH